MCLKIQSHYITILLLQPPGYQIAGVYHHARQKKFSINVKILCIVNFKITQ